MSLKLLKTTGQAFMSFGEEFEQVWNDIGLTLFEGINKAAKSASSNGAGKTTLPEAIVWGLFGKTTKEIGVDDVVNTKMKKGCRVTNIIGNTETEETWEITRYRKDKEHGNSLYFSHIDADGTKTDLSGVDAKATQNNIDNFLGGSFTLFCNSVYFSQNNIKPFSLFTDKQMKNALVEALDLNRFFVALEHVRLDLKTARKEQDLVQGKIDRVEEEKEEHRSREADYKRQHEEFDTLKKTELERLECVLDRAKEKLSAVDTLKENRAAMVVELKERHGLIEGNTAEEDLAKVIKVVDPLKTNITVLDSKRRDINRQFTTKATEAKNIKDRIGTDCGECGKTIVKEDVGALLAASVKAAKKLREKIDSMDALIAKAKTAKGKYDGRIEKLNADVEALNDHLGEIDDLNHEIEKLKYGIDQAPAIQKEVKAAEEAYKAKDAEENPFAGLMHKESTLFDEAHDRFVTLNRLLTEKKKTVEELEYLETMFGYSGIPAFLLDSVTPFLNERSNHYATMICDGEIQIVFSTTSKTKAGKIREKFSIVVAHEKGGKNYKAISGGERKRADLCIAQAMQDLCRSYGKNPLDIVFYDEPFEHLDGAGVGGVLEMLSALEKELGTVAVVTHNDEMKSAFTKTITVVKDTDEISRLVA